MFSNSLILFLTFLSFSGNEGANETTEIRPNSRIVGGREAALGEFPYVVNLDYHNEGTTVWSHGCGGVIISPSKILTAAHCKGVNGGKYHSIRITAGDVDRAGPILPSTQEREVDVDKFTQHPQYDWFTHVNDIGVIKLDTALDFNQYVKSITLPSAGHVASGKANVTGWGATAEGGDAVNKLRNVEVDIFSDQQCSDMYGDDFGEHMVCAGTLDGSKDSCQGDSGGPLACSQLGVPFLVGLVSWGNGCGKATQLGFYTKVADYLDWIKTVN